MSKFLDSLKDREIFVDEDIEYDKVIQTTSKEKLATCAICGKLFIKEGKGSGRAIYCPRQHYVKCMICGNRVDITQQHIHFHCRAPKTCSKKCADLIGVQTYKENCVKKYGVTNPMLDPKQVKYMISKRNPNFDFSLKEEEQIRNCEICGKEFKFDYLHPRKTCSEECRLALYNRSMPILTKKCEYCGKEFTTNFVKAKYCNGPHYKKCEICGKEYLITSMDNPSKTCSEECSQQLSRRTCMKHYGVPVGSQSEEAKEKLRLAAEINRWKHIELPKPKEPTPPIIKNCSLCGQPFELEDNAQRICKRQHYRNCDVCGKLYQYNAPWTQLCCSSICTQHKRTSNKNIVSCDGLPLDSSYEKLVYDFWKSLGLEIRRNISIIYEYEGKEHTTFIDFEVNGILFEVKGAHLLQGLNPWGGVPIEKKLEIYKKNHVVIITDNGSTIRELTGKPNSTQSNGLKYLNKCPEPLIGVDIELFKDSPKFPYAKDRPKCFYEVSVDGMRSAHSAFYDPDIRWKMIVNRIQYSGGFIDNKQVLTAMNVSRICKQPSWFSKTFAEELIKKYCTSNTIVDPFAGWGARCDAAMNLGKTYIGVDLNEELVNWHKSLNRPIKLGDATIFKYNEECSVFICPPYQDKEVYFESQNSELTQCDWLSVVMKNVPNAKEYLMVCKIVDPGWEKYIVDIKENKSHFGTNKEYMLLVNNKSL